MLLSVVALVIGAILGLLGRGSLRHLTTWRLRSWWLVVAGAALQLAAERSTLGGAGIVVLLAGYGCLVVFAIRNVLLIGMGVAAVGLVANVTVVAANRAMPVSPGAVVAAGIASSGQLGEISYGPRHRLERRGDRLMFLDDRLPVPALNQVLSIGDLIVAFGVADVAAHLVRRPRRRRLTWQRPRYHLAPPGWDEEPARSVGWTGHDLQVAVERIENGPGDGLAQTPSIRQAPATLTAERIAQDHQDTRTKVG